MNHLPPIDTNADARRSPQELRERVKMSLEASSYAAAQIAGVSAISALALIGIYEELLKLNAREDRP